MQMDWPCFQNKVIANQERYEEKPRICETPATEYIGSNPNLSHEKQKDGEITELDNDKTTSTTEEALPLNAINDINMQTEETLI